MCAGLYNERLSNLFSSIKFLLLFRLGNQLLRRYWQTHFTSPYPLLGPTNLYNCFRQTLYIPHVTKDDSWFFTYLLDYFIVPVLWINLLSSLRTIVEYYNEPIGFHLGTQRQQQWYLYNTARVLHERNYPILGRGL